MGSGLNTFGVRHPEAVKPEGRNATREDIGQDRISHAPIDQANSRFFCIKALVKCLLSKRHTNWYFENSVQFEFSRRSSTESLFKYAKGGDHVARTAVTRSLPLLPGGTRVGPGSLF